LTYAVQDDSNSWSTTTFSAQSATKVAAVQLNGWNFAPLTSTLGAAAATSSSSSPAAPTTSSLNPNPSSTSPVTKISDPGLGKGARAGVGVVITLGLLLLLSVVGYYFLLQRRRGQMKLLQDETVEMRNNDMEMVKPTTVKPARPPSL
jgi:hypothetical protein